MPSSTQQIWIVRHSDTEWSLDGRHTGRTDVPLTPAGELKADQLAPQLAKENFALVLSTPLSRGLETARRAGFADRVQPDPNLLEWDYGKFEGLTSVQIAAMQPNWDLWRDGCPNGESIEAVAVRARAIVQRCLATQGNVLLFSHGHFSRMIAAVWLELPPTRGRSFGLKAGSISMLGFEHANRVIWQWNRVNTFEGH
ncbi:MAG: histidine phosphatase family protein [Planctomycetota bacterium]|nr:histidine phosphatase family protein [Planctomycetota bacterium]MDA1263260.1 histidine phosphatase family protein [Planctomycetota bacterium]